MRSTFGHYYTPSADDLDSFLAAGLIVLDTNVLLDLFRSPEKTTDELLKVLKAAKSQLWMPYQVGLEYHENIDRVISEIRRRHEGFTATLEKGLNELRGSFSDYRHPFIRESVLAEVDALEDRLVQALLSSWSIDKLNDRAQSVRKQIEELYEDSMIGAPFSEEELSAICSEGERRYKNEIPPGFKDARKTGDPRRPYGDLILWNEVLRKAKESGRPIILVTDDAKEDWWFRVSGETIGPLPALRREMLKEAGQRFHLYTSEQFLKHGARTFLKREADSQALQDVERAGRAEQLRDEGAVARRERLLEKVQCPHCGSQSEAALAADVGSSSWSVCPACGNGFHVHRDRSGLVFTNVPYSRLSSIGPSVSAESSAQIEVDCPSCGMPVSWYLGRESGRSSKPHCASCNRWFHAHRASDGSVIVRLPGGEAAY